MTWFFKTYIMSAFNAAQHVLCARQSRAQSTPLSPFQSAMIVTISISHVERGYWSVCKKTWQPGPCNPTSNLGTWIFTIYMLLFKLSPGFHRTSTRLPTDFHRTHTRLLQYYFQNKFQNSRWKPRWKHLIRWHNFMWLIDFNRNKTIIEILDSNV